MEDKRPKRKSPAAAALLSAFVYAGMGQIYVRDYKKGAVLIAVYTVFLVLTLKPILSGYQNYLSAAADIENPDLSTTALEAAFKPNIASIILLTIVWLFSIADAFISAKKYNSSLEPIRKPES